MGESTTPLWAHQKKAIQKASTLDYFALFFELGCGKSRTLIHILEEKFQENEGPLRTLIFCPLIVVENLKREFLKFGKLNESLIQTLTGPMRFRLKEFEANKDKSIVITNFEALYRKPLLKAFYDWFPEVLVIDEIHKLKDFKAARTKIVTNLASTCKYRYGLSGTPILNSELDLFTQIRILDNGDTFGSNFYVFRAKYFYDVNAARKGTHSYFPMWRPREGIGNMLWKQIERFCVRVKKKDCLDLPPFHVVEKEVEMGEKQAEAYNAMKKDFVAYLFDKACVADLAITKALRLQQIVSGFVKFEDDTEVTFDEVPRLQAVEKLVSDIVPNAKVIIWAVFKKNYEMLEKLMATMKIPYAMLHGETSNKQAEIDRFQTDPTCRVMIANPGAGGIGINLTEASYMIYYSKTFSLEHDLQSEARAYRGGSEIHEKITRVDLVSKNTIDEIISKALLMKKEIGERVLDRHEIIALIKSDIRGDNFGPRRPHSI